MKKSMLAAATVIAYTIATAVTALAQSELPPPEQPVAGTVVTPPDGGTAFTGADLGIWIVAIAALIVVGTAVFIVGRRRAASVG